MAKAKAKVKVKDLDKLIEEVKIKTKDPDSIMRLGGNKNKIKTIDVIPTGSLMLDTAIGIGGVPKGRIVEIYGPESSGKTTLTLHIVAESQKAGGSAAFIDVEHRSEERRVGKECER